ncbi:hypothetical protein [Methylocella sp.]|uniref:hypothetical protein n=1 Tax=Methylocella sp. TaxID=1978226 RepID=UPI003C273349
MGASRIVKAGEILPQALIPTHEKLALKADASRVETSTARAAKPRIWGERRIIHPFLELIQEYAMIRAF